MIEMKDLFPQMEIFESRWATITDAECVLIIRNNDALLCREAHVSAVLCALMGLAPTSSFDRFRSVTDRAAPAA
jgi:hypothetical protein